MAPHSSTLAWKILWMEEPGRLQSMGSLRVGHDWVTSLSLFTSCIGEGNGNPLQCSCLRIPGTGVPGGLPSMGLHRVGHNWSDLAAAAVEIGKKRPSASSWKSKSPQCIFKEWGIKAPGKPSIQGIFTQRPWSCDRSHLASPFHPSNNILLLLPDKLSQECRSTDEVYKMICIHALSQHCQCKWQLFKKTVPNIPTEGTNQA